MFAHYYNKESLFRIVYDSEIAGVFSKQWAITNNFYFQNRILILSENKTAKGSETWHVLLHRQEYLE